MTQPVVGHSLEEVPVRGRILPLGVIRRFRGVEVLQGLFHASHPVKDRSDGLMRTCVESPPCPRLLGQAEDRGEIGHRVRAQGGRPGGEKGRLDIRRRRKAIDRFRTHLAVLRLLAAREEGQGTAVQEIPGGWGVGRVHPHELREVVRGVSPFFAASREVRVEDQHPQIAGLQFHDLAVVLQRLDPLLQPQVDVAASLPGREALRLQLDGPRRLRDSFVGLLQRQVRPGAVNAGAGMIRLRFPCQPVREEFGAVQGIPDPDRTILTSTRKNIAARREGDAQHPVRVICQGAQLAAADHVPQPDCVVGAGRGQGLPVRGEGHVKDPVGVPPEHAQRLARGHIPEAERRPRCRSPACGRRARRPARRRCPDPSSSAPTSRSPRPRAVGCRRDTRSPVSRRLGRRRGTAPYSCAAVWPPPARRPRPRS